MKIQNHKSNLLGTLSGIILALMLIAPAFASGIVDPTYIGVGARPLGMGKAYVAVADGAETLFFNPAGLGQQKGVKLTSMYTSLVSDVNYVMVGGIYPNAAGNSAFGVGLISSNISDIDLYDSDGGSLGTGTWNNNVLVLSYGTDFGAIGGIKGVKVGADLKYFSSGGTGTASIESAAGSGFDADIGMLCNPTPWMALGANFVNILPASMGGVITRNTGTSDAIAATAKAGIKLNVMGDKEKSLYASDQDLILALDVDYPLEQSGVSTTMHLGAEYWPVPALALRAGLDQDPAAISGGVVSNPTAGVGIRMGGIEFDYAYHPYNGVADDTTHFFSLSYVGTDIKPLFTKTLPTEIQVLSPDDKKVVYEDTIAVSGIVKNVDFKQTEVSIDGVFIPLDKDGKFDLTIPAKELGKKLIAIEARDTKKNTVLASVDRRVIRLTSYEDVGTDYWAKSPIEETGTLGLVEGYPDGTFRPDRALTRAELAALLVRASGLALADGGKSFKDVPAQHWANAYIKTAQVAGLMEGYPDGKFKPEKQISRAEGIAVLARVDELPLDETVTINPYADVSKKSWPAKYVQAAKNAGMLDYVKTSTLSPKGGLTRAEAVTMLSKTSFASAKIKELMSWVTGFKKTSMRPQETSRLPETTTF
ncbi:MAG: PorV/PorQ family protein [Candidatus Margulisiibacteriota bacterium]